MVLKGKKVDAPVVDKTEVKDNIQNTIPDKNTPTQNPAVIKPITAPPVVLTQTQKDLLAKETKAVLVRDYVAFADILLEVYKNQWAEIDDFKKVESEFYVYTYNTYWLKGDLANSLKFSTIVYNKISEAWRFRYLRILTLEKYGRDAYNAGDLKTAESYAMQILQMMYRPEGANLLADVYISKINTNIKNCETAMAKNNLAFIWDYEISQDRRDTLTSLKKQLGL
ncbi:MAG: hypothetical protein NTV24_05190 [Candidatus Woesebacteria bacterium]|nr:hypothetical protein [Candidatus Woesebacteria bacterium]